MNKNELAFLEESEIRERFPEDGEEAVDYFNTLFSELEKYVDTSLKVINEASGESLWKEKIQQLKHEVATAKGLGDFDRLIVMIDDKMNDMEKTKSNDSATTEESLGTNDYGKLGDLALFAEKAEELAKQNAWQNAQVELEKIKIQWEEKISGEEALAEEPGYNDLLGRIQAAETLFFERKAFWLEKRRLKKKENFEKREHILEQFQALIDQNKWHSFKEINALVRKWEDIKDLPNREETQGQEQAFEEIRKKFEEKKVKFIVKKAEKEDENLLLKLTILDKLKNLIASITKETKEWQRIDTETDELIRQWKKIGRVSPERSAELWTQFKSLQDDLFQKKMEFNKEFRNQVKKHIQKKMDICTIAESLLQEKDLPYAVKKMNGLHKRWKNAGTIPKEKNDELWERFHAASKKFNEIKSENQDLLRKQEEENYAKKIALCENAEELKNETRWGETSAKMEKLMESWKQIGTVSGKKANKVWNRFRAAMDDFYNQKREHFRLIREEEKKNLEKKQEVLSGLIELQEVENPEELASKAKELQDKYKSIGFVPIKKKDKLEKEYKDACDKIYRRLRAEKGAGTALAGSLDSGGGDDPKILQKKLFGIKKEIDRLNEEKYRLEDTKTFINPKGKGESLIAELQKKIDKIDRQLEEKTKTMKDIDRKKKGAT